MDFTVDVQMPGWKKWSPSARDRRVFRIRKVVTEALSRYKQTDCRSLNNLDNHEAEYKYEKQSRISLCFRFTSVIINLHIVSL